MTNEQRHTPGPWMNREGTILADTREQTCCGRPCVGAEYMGQQEMVCCGNPDMDGDEEDTIAVVTYERDIPLVIAAPELLGALRSARAYIQSNRDSFAECHRNPATGQLEPANVCEDDDALLALIDTALAKATGESP